jgi:hypothetical protein
MLPNINQDQPTNGETNMNNKSEAAGLKVKPIKLDERTFNDLLNNTKNFNVLPYGNNDVHIHSRKHCRMVARKLDGKITGFIYE